MDDQRRGVAGEVVLLDQHHAKAAARRVAGDAGAVDAAADDEQVVPASPSSSLLKAASARAASCQMFEPMNAQLFASENKRQPATDSDAAATWSFTSAASQRSRDGGRRRLVREQRVHLLDRAEPHHRVAAELGVVGGEEHLRASWR